MKLRNWITVGLMAASLAVSAQARDFDDHARFESREMRERRIERERRERLERLRREERAERFYHYGR